MLVQSKLNLVVCLEALLQGLYMNFSLNVFGFQKFCDLLTKKKTTQKCENVMDQNVVSSGMLWNKYQPLYHVDALRETLPMTI